MANAPSASRSPAMTTPPAAETAVAASGARAAATRPAADITAITTRDDFLLELGGVLEGRAALRPVDSLAAALESLSATRRAQVLVIDTREMTEVRAAVEAAHSSPAGPVVLVFAEGPAERALGSALAGSHAFAVLPVPLDVGKTRAALEGAIAAAVASRSALRRAEAGSADGGTAAPQPLLPETPGAAAARAFPLALLIGAGAAALALIAAGTFWYLSHASPARPSGSAVHPPAGAGRSAAPTPVAETSVVQGKVDELLEKARLAMHERRFSEPAGNNALLYYRSAAAADPGNAEARDGLQRVAGALAARFEEALNGGRLEEAAATLTSLKSAAPADARLASFEERLYAAQFARALADGNDDRASTLVHQAQQSGIAPEQIARWRTEIAHHQDEAKVQHLAGLIDDRIHDGRLVEADDSALAYLEQLQSDAPTHAATQRAVHELVSACLRKAREAGLARNSAEEDRWVSAARSAGARAADISAFEKDLAATRAKAAQAESGRLLELARERLREGHLTDPAADSAAGYLTQLQSSDPANPAAADARGELAKALLDRARAAVLAGKPDDGDLAQAKRWGADPKELAAVQELKPPGAAGAVDPAALAASLKRVRNVPPDYPPNALAQRISGSVLLGFTVDTRGEPRDIQVLESTPPQVFEQAAINAIRRWRYAPMIVNGAAVEVPVKTRIRFELPK